MEVAILSLFFISFSVFISEKLVSMEAAETSYVGAFSAVCRISEKLVSMEVLNRLYILLQPF